MDVKHHVYLLTFRAQFVHGCCVHVKRQTPAWPWTWSWAWRGQNQDVINIDVVWHFELNVCMIVACAWNLRPRHGHGPGAERDGDRTRPHQPHAVLLRAQPGGTSAPARGHHHQGSSWAISNHSEKCPTQSQPPCLLRFRHMLVKTNRVWVQTGLTWPSLLLLTLPTPPHYTSPCCQHCFSGFL